MGEHAKPARPSGLVALMACAVLAVPGLAACGDDEARYVIPPDSAWAVWATGVDKSGTVVLTGENRALIVAPGDATGIVGSEAFEPPAELGDETDARGVSVDLGRRAWVLTGDALVPVAATDAAVHPARDALTAITNANPGAALPGAEPRLARTTTALAVEGDESVIVASRAPLGDSRARVNVTVHRLTADGPAELLAGRAWTGTPDRPAPAADIPVGEEAPATAVDLDDVAAVQQLDATRMLIVTQRPTTESPGVLSFFLLDGITLRHLDVGRFAAGRGTPPVSASLLLSGLVVLNLSTGIGAQAEPAALHLNANTGASTVFERSPADSDGIGRLVAADADGGKLVVVTSPGGDAADEDNVANVRIATVPDPADG